MKLPHVFVRARRDESGTAAIEFAFIASFLLVLLVGITDVSRLALASMRVRYAAEAGATFAAFNGSEVEVNDPAVIAAATAATSANATTTTAIVYGCARPSGVQIVPSATTTCIGYGSPHAPGKYVSVTSQADFAPYFQPAFIVYPQTLSQTLQVRVK